MTGVGSVIHTTGLAHQFRHMPDDGRCHRDNVLTTDNPCRAAVAAGVRKVIFASSMTVYVPYEPASVTESTVCRPHGAYARSQLEAEQRAIGVTGDGRMSLTILRMATLHGDGNPDNVGRLIQVIDRRRCVWIGRSENRKNLVHVDDATQACVAAVFDKRIHGCSGFTMSRTKSVGWRTLYGKLLLCFHGVYRGCAFRSRGRRPQRQLCPSSRRSDARGAAPVRRAVTPAHVLHTIYRRIGIDTSVTHPDWSRRPHPILTTGDPIAELC